MPSARQQKSKAKSPAKATSGARAAERKPAAKTPSKRSAPAAGTKPSTVKSAVPKTTPKSAPRTKTVEPELEVPLPGGRKHVLSLSFVRDGDEFLARLESDAGHFTELKNRSLDQLLTLVASELEDLLE